MSDVLSGACGDLRRASPGAGIMTRALCSARRVRACKPVQRQLRKRDAASATRARLEDRVDLAAVLENLPRAGEARRHDEGISGLERPALACIALENDPPGSHDAQLVLRV